MNNIKNLSYEFLYEFYLVAQTQGDLGQFNKTYFPNHYTNMKTALEDLKSNG